MATKTRVYLDTSALIAFRDRSDTYHPLFVQLFSDPPPLVTTPLVISEGQGWFLKRYDPSRAIEFMNFIETLTVLQILSFGKSEMTRAAGYQRRFSDQDLTLADAAGLWLMDDLKINTCWSTDFHLGLTGRSLIIHASS